MRALRVLLWTIGVIAGLAALGLGVFYFAPSNWVAGYLADKARAATGRELVIEGEIDRGLFPRLHFATGRVSLSNADWAGDEPLLQAAGAQISSSVWSLLAGRLAIEQFTLDQPELALEINEDGEANYAFTVTEPTAPTAEDEQPPEDAATIETVDIEQVDGPAGAYGFNLSVVEAAIRDGAMTFIDRRGDQRADVTNVHVTLGLEGLSETLRLQGGAIVNGRDVTVEGEINSIASLRRNGEVDAVMAITADGVAFDFDGALDVAAWDELPSANGQFSLLLSDDLEETEWLRRALPVELAPLGTLDLSGVVVADSAKLQLDIEGDGVFNGEQTTLRLKGDAGEGWMTGRETANLDIALKNQFLDVGYIGQAGRLPGAEAPAFNGGYRILAPDIKALALWAQPLEYVRGATPPPRLERIDLKGDLSVLDWSIKASAEGDVRYNRQDVLVEADVTGGADWRDGAPVTSTINLWSELLGRASWRGDARFLEAGPRIDGKLDFESPSVARLRSWIGIGFLDRDYGALAFDGDVSINPDMARLSGADLIIGASLLEIDLMIERREARPYLKLDMRGGPFDLTPVLFDPRSLEERQAKTLEPWNEAPFGHEMLREFDANLTLGLMGFRLNDLEFGRLAAQAALAGGVGRIDVEHLELYGGRADGKAIFDARGAELETTAEMKIVDLNLETFLRGVGRDDLLTGRAALRASADASGASMLTLMNSVNGRGRLSLANGAFLAVNFNDLNPTARDLLRTLGARQATPGVTPYNTATASFSASQGRLRNRDLDFQGVLIGAKGEGLIDLGDQTLDYVITATRFGRVGSGVDEFVGRQSPIAITGRWISPRVAPAE